MVRPDFSDVFAGFDELDNITPRKEAPTQNNGVSQDVEQFDNFDGYEPIEAQEYSTEVEAIGEVEERITPEGKTQAQGQEQSAHVDKQSEQTQGKNDQFSKLDSMRRQFDYTRPFKKTEYVGGLFARSSLSVIMGASGVGKSTLLLKCIRDIGGCDGDADDQYRAVFADNKGQHLAVEMKAKSVVLLTGELGEDSVNERANEFSWNIKPDNFEVVDLLRFEEAGITLNINEPEGFANFEHLAQKQGLDLIVLDSLGMFHTLKESDNDGLRILFKNLAGIARRYDIAIGIIHHCRKRLTSEQTKPLTLDDMIGGSAISRYVHRVFAIEYNRERDLNTVTCLKSWKIWPKPFGYKKVDETWGHSRLEFVYDLDSIDIPQKTTTPTKSLASEAETLREKIVIALRARKNEPIKVQDLIEFLGIEESGENTFKSVLKRMTDNKELVRIRRGVYELPEDSVKITTDAEEDTEETLEFDLEE